MFVQTEITPNPNSLKFIPGKVVSSAGSFEVTKNDNVNNELVRNILSINGVEGIFLSKDFISEIFNILYTYETIFIVNCILPTLNKLTQVSQILRMK